MKIYLRCSIAFCPEADQDLVMDDLAKTGEVMLTDDYLPDIFSVWNSKWNNYTSTITKAVLNYECTYISESSLRKKMKLHDISNSNDYEFIVSCKLVYPESRIAQEIYKQSINVFSFSFHCCVSDNSRRDTHNDLQLF